ncbi:XRE family transcriptional regulator [Sphingomonas cavernae]|uniref:XRE family transcriptional regulator n=1 Tax=Sphingomonas cavernae TaxID=2320861 RepID=A0A418WRD2_9SPHN|nr:XRE family transcriptional regulator [Sphingomonas cavernae]RJF93812.1 XRE family transcriptional regulator [Sphingomonas cavernae]
MPTPAASRLTNEEYREAVATVVRRIQQQHGLSDGAFADRIGCSAGTIRNARNRTTNLDGVTLANIERIFGPGAIDPFLALAGARATPLATSPEAGNPTLDIVDALHRIIETQDPQSEGGTRTTPRELLAILQQLRDARGAFDALILIADPPPLSDEPPFRLKPYKRMAIVRTQGGQVTHSTLLEARTDDTTRPS